jgi:hypothetical protein
VAKARERILTLRATLPDTEVRARSMSFGTCPMSFCSVRSTSAWTYDLGQDATFRRDLLVKAALWAWVTPQVRHRAGSTEVLRSLAPNVSYEGKPVARARINVGVALESTTMLANLPVS